MLGGGVGRGAIERSEIEGAGTARLRPKNVAVKIGSIHRRRSLLELTDRFFVVSWPIPVSLSRGYTSATTARTVEAGGFAIGDWVVVKDVKSREQAVDGVSRVYVRLMA